MKRSTTLVLIFLAVLLGLGGRFYTKHGPQYNALQTREVATRGLAEYLARTHPGKRALVISNPYTKETKTGGNMNAFEKAGVRGLHLGFGNKIDIETVAFPELKPEAKVNPRSVLPLDAPTTTPLSYLVTPDAFDKLAGQHPSCSLLVSLIGLPADLSKVELWQTAGGPKLALLLPDLRMVGDTAAIRAALQEGKIAAFVLNRPGAPPEQEASRQDFSAEFERRFVLVHPENVSSVLERWPGLF